MRQAAHLQWLERYDECARVSFHALQHGACPSAHYLLGTSLIGLGRSVEGIEHLRHARKMILGGCRLYADSLAGVMQQAIQTATQQFAAAATGESQAFWRAELREWIRHLAAQSPEALVPLLADGRLASLRREIQALRAPGCNLGLELRP